MSQTILDHTRDLTGAETYRLTQLYDPPEFVKSASHEDLHGDPEKVSANTYGDPVHRVYPCHTKAATWLSALFFADKQRTMQPELAEAIKQRLTKSANWWQIGTEVNNLWEKMAHDATDQFSQLADDQFAFVWEGGGQKERRYPLRNAAEVKMASAWFGNYHGEFPFADKNTIASKILVKAAEYGAVCENQELLDRCAGYGYSSAVDAAAAWEQRAGLIQSQYPDHSAQAMKVATSIRETGLEVHDQGIRIKMAGLLDQFDRETGLDSMYDAGLARPEDTLFMITEKVASDFLSEHVQTTTGAIYDRASLEKISAADLRAWMGDDLTDECGGVMIDTEKLAELIPTLPRPEAEMFEQMASSLSIPVAAREKAASQQGLPLAEMRALASEYEAAAGDQPDNYLNL